MPEKSIQLNAAVKSIQHYSGSEVHRAYVIESAITHYGYDLLKLFMNIQETSVGIEDKKNRIFKMCEEYGIEIRLFSNFF